MNNLLFLLAGVALGARFDKEIKEVVPILDGSAKTTPRIETKGGD